VSDLAGDDVRHAVEVCTGALWPRLGDNWSAQVPGLDFTVSSVIAHASVTSLWYSLDVWAGREDSAGFELSVKADASPEALVAGLAQAGMACAASVDAAAPDQRGYHPYGSPDPSGFAAMACAELLIHTDDALRGLRNRLDAPRELAADVLARLFPWHAPDADPWLTLLWAHNRPTDRPTTAGTWRWHPAPLHEWRGATS
jgi:hypothetical protein